MLRWVDAIDGCEVTTMLAVEKEPRDEGVAWYSHERCVPFRRAQFTAGVQRRDELAQQLADASWVGW